MKYFSHKCPVCDKSVLPACFKPREDMTDTEWAKLADMTERKLAVHMVTEHPDELDTPVA